MVWVPPNVFIVTSLLGVQQGKQIPAWDADKMVQRPTWFYHF